MAAPVKEERPSIRLHAHSQITDDQLIHVLLGIEEEGVPVIVERQDELNPLALAHRAALASRLGIGLGVALDYAVVTYEKLPAEKPYLAAQLNVDAATDRIIGSNAARMVKRIPLRPIGKERNS